MPPLNYYNISQQQDLIEFAERIVRKCSSRKTEDVCDDDGSDGLIYRSEYIDECIDELGEELIDIINAP